MKLRDFLNKVEHQRVKQILADACGDQDMQDCTSLLEADWQATSLNLAIEIRDLREEHKALTDMALSEGLIGSESSFSTIAE